MRLFKNLSIVVVLLFSSHQILTAQTNAAVKKIHGYQQEISGGAAVSTDGNNPASNTNTRYFIYLETSVVNSVTIQSVYINGTAYKGRALKSPNSILIPGESKKTKLTSNNSNKLWQIELQTADEAVPNALKNLVQKNDVVITGFAKGKKFTSVLKRLKVLKPVEAE